MKKTIYLFLIILTSVLLINMQSCSSSKKTVAEGDATSEEQEIQNDYQEIERLLGITRDKPSQTPPVNKEENDLLKLLEVDEGKKETKTVPPEVVQTPPPENPVVDEVTEMDVVQMDTLRKDREVQELPTRAPLGDTGKISSEGDGSLPTRGGIDLTPPPEINTTASPERYVYEIYKADYDRGLSYFHERRYSAAVVVFEQLLAVDTHNDYSDNAQYWMGESYYAMGKYREAIMAFEKVLTFRSSNKNDYAQFKIGQCYYMLGDKSRARQEFQVFLDNYPKSELVARANSYLAHL